MEYGTHSAEVFILAICFLSSYNSSNRIPATEDVDPGLYVETTKQNVSE